MLVLTRRLQEKIIIGKNVIIQILGVKGNQIRLGFSAPLEIKIFREELCKQIRERDTA